MSIASKLAEVAEIKEDLRGAINEHFTTERLSVNDGLSSYAQAIDEITLTGPNLPTEPKAVNFIDYDGTLLYAFTAAEFQAMSGLPHNPFHSGLIAQGWNWTREEILDYLTRAERIDVGQNYITNDGATRLYINLVEERGLEQSLYIAQSKSEGVLVNWGDGNSERVDGVENVTFTHTYANYGNYTISLIPDDDTFYRLSHVPYTTTYVEASHNTLFGKVATNYTNFQNLYKVELGKNIWDSIISSGAFYSTINLETISVPKEVLGFGTHCFNGCRSLQSIVFSSGTTHIYAYSIKLCAKLKYVCIPTSVISFENSAFQWNSMDYILIPDGVTNINVYCFQNNRLENIYLSRNLTTVSNSGFGGCQRLKKIYLPQTVRALAPVAFANCWSLQYIKVPEGVTTFNSQSFMNCYSAYEIDLPSTTTSIYANTFSQCWNVRRIIIRATTPPSLGGTGAFTGAWGTGQGASYRSTPATFYVPYSEDHSILDAYKNTDATNSWAYYLTWCEFKELNPDGTIPEKVEEGGE